MFILDNSEEKVKFRNPALEAYSEPWKTYKILFIEKGFQPLTIFA